MLMKSRLAGAQKGHGLLKKKADALQMRFRMILGKIIEVSSPDGFVFGTFRWSLSDRRLLNRGEKIVANGVNDAQVSSRAKVS